MANRGFLMAFVLSGVAACQPEGSPEIAFPPSSVTQVVLLGTGTPNAEPDRAGSAVAIVVNGTPYLVDAGAGIVHRANEAFQHGIAGLGVSRLSRVFLTHLHTDHTVGLPDLIYTPWVLGRESPLMILGPAGTEAMAEHLSKAYENDVRVRLEGLEPANPTGYQVEARDVDAGLIYQDDNVKVTAFQVPHGAWELAFGFRFETPDRTVVVSGDTRPSEAVVQFCHGCDILIHEVYSSEKWELKPDDWKEYHAASHTSGIQLGELAARARPGLLVLTHQLLWGATPDELVAEVRAGFDGRIAYGRDLDVF
jgi:ribonuclease BN (tRNA processing enzyme)